MTTVPINHKPTTTTPYTGLDDGAVPVTVYRKAKFIISHISEPEMDNFFHNKFRMVIFVDLKTGNLFQNTIMDGRVYNDLVADGVLVKGNRVELNYEVKTGWIKTIDDKGWH